MADEPATANYRNLLRFYRVARPHWKLVVVAIGAASVYVILQGILLMLIEPIVEAIGPEEREVAATAVAEREARAAPRDEATDAPEAEPPDGLKEKALERLGRLGAVQRVKGWLRPGSDPGKIAALIAFILGPLMVLSKFLEAYAQRRAVWHVMADLRMAIFDRLSVLSLRYFGKQRTGELVSRLTNDIQSTQMAVKILFGRAYLEPLRLTVFLAIALHASWQLTILAHVTFPPLLFLMHRYGKRIRRYGTKNLERLADVTDSVTQMLSGIRVVKAFNMERAENEEFRERNRAQLQQAFKLVRTRALAESVPEYLYLVPFALVIVVSDYLARETGLKVAGMLQCMAALAMMGNAVRKMVSAYADLQSSIPGANRAFELIDTRAEIQDSPDAVDLDGVREGVRFSGVWFAYDEEPVLRGIDLFVPAGNVYAIVGETGAGKSTLLDLVPRFYDATRGSVSIDGVDVRRIRRDELMRRIAIVSQQPFLFNRSIGENIRYGKPDATQEEIVEAARAANIHEFIESLPEGYNTSVGESGGRLSGGQRQCITIARALLKNAPILILDEATSSLDAQSEMLVQHALGNLMKNRTTFVIAHRLSTVRHADRIVVLRDGRIVEQGTHEELLKQAGEYGRLYRIQFAGQSEES